MTLIQLRRDQRADGLSCETFIEPASEWMYQIAQLPGDGRFFPMCVKAPPRRADGTRGEPGAPSPIDVPGQPGMVYVCDTYAEALAVIDRASRQHMI